MVSAVVSVPDVDSRAFAISPSPNMTNFTDTTIEIRTINMHIVICACFFITTPSVSKSVLVIMTDLSRISSLDKSSLETNPYLMILIFA